HTAADRNELPALASLPGAASLSESACSYRRNARASAVRTVGMEGTTSNVPSPATLALRISSSIFESRTCRASSPETRKRSPFFTTLSLAGGGFVCEAINRRVLDVVGGVLFQDGLRTNHSAA